MSLDHCYCPGCGSRLPKRNTGCKHCGYEGYYKGSARLLTIAELIAQPGHPDPGALYLNDVSPRFIRAIVEATRAECANPPGPEA